MSGTTSRPASLSTWSASGRGRTIGALDDHGGTDPVGVAGVDDALDGGRHQQIDIGLEQFGVGEFLARAEPDDRAGRIDVFLECGDVQAHVRRDRAVLVGDRNNSHTGLGQEPCGIPADLAEALHGRGGAVDPDPAGPQGGEGNVEHGRATWRRRGRASRRG